MVQSYLHSVPVQVWQRQGGQWVGYFMNASIMNDVSKADSTRVINMTFGYGATQQNYNPRINDIIVPIADMTDTGGSFQFFGTRSNQPYYWAGVNDSWKTRPAILFLTAFNETTLQFSDFFSVPEYGLVAAGSVNLQTAVQNVAAEVWNRLIAGHPILKPTQAANILPYQTTLTTLQNDNPTPMKLNELCQQLAAARDWRSTGGSAYFPPLENQWSTLTWLGTQDLGTVAFDLRKEDILKLEVRSRESSDAPNVLIAYDKTGRTQQVWRDSSYNLHWGTPPTDSSWSLRATYQEVDDATDNGETGDKAIQYLSSPAQLNLSDISILLDMSSRYNTVYSTDINASWSLPVAGEPCHIFGYLPEGAIVVPVMEYDFAAAQLLIATNNDITLGQGV